MYSATPAFTLSVCCCADHLFWTQVKAVGSLKRLVKKPLKGWCLTLCWPPNQLTHLQNTVHIFGAGELSHKLSNRATGGEYRGCLFFLFYFMQLFFEVWTHNYSFCWDFQQLLSFRDGKVAFFLSPAISGWSIVTNLYVLVTWTRSIKPLRPSDVCWDGVGADTKLGMAHPCCWKTPCGQWEQPGQGWSWEPRALCWPNLKHGDISMALVFASRSLLILSV